MNASLPKRLVSIRASNPKPGDLSGFHSACVHGAKKQLLSFKRRGKINNSDNSHSGQLGTANAQQLNDIREKLAYSGFTPLRVPRGKPHKGGKVLIEEETLPDYDPKNYYPVEPGVVIRNNGMSYLPIGKLGFGDTSTVWMAQKWFTMENGFRINKGFVALKFKTCSPDSRDMEMLHTPRDPGPLTSHIRCMADSFVEKFQGRSFAIMDLELHRETLGRFRIRMKQERFSIHVVKIYMKYILIGLSQLHHDRRRIVHTDLTEDNILMEFEEEQTLAKPGLRITLYLGHMKSKPMRYVLSKKDPESRVYITRGNFHGTLKPEEQYRLKISDLGLAQLVSGTTPIQRDQYRAPEVILGTGWSYSADIWNAGVLMWKLVMGKDVFESPTEDGKLYSARAHLGQMIGFLGAPPTDSKLLKTSQSNQHRWATPLPNPSGKICDNAIDYYNGPFFDKNGEFLYPNLIPATQTHNLSFLKSEEKVEFLEFSKLLLQWQPEDRKTAAELLNHPWITSASVSDFDHMARHRVESGGRARKLKKEKQQAELKAMEKAEIKATQDVETVTYSPLRI